MIPNGTVSHNADAIDEMNENEAERMDKIKIERNPSEGRLRELGVMGWPIWTKEVSEFPWSYDEPEICYFLEGEVVVTPDEDDPAEIKKGDLVTFPKGMSCTWKILKNVKKHYQFG